MLLCFVFFFFFKQKTDSEFRFILVGSEMCIRDRGRICWGNSSVSVSGDGGAGLASTIKGWLLYKSGGAGGRTR